MDRIDLPRRVAAEAAGTAALLATVVGTGIMAERLAAGGAIALLANSLATGAILVVLIATLAPLSGAHFNPVVSLVAWLRRELPALEALAYAGAQVAGAVAGTVLAHLMFEEPAFQVSATVRSGGAQLLAEGVAVFGLVAVILVNARTGGRSLPGLIGAYIGAAYWFTASTSFANPAATIARSLTDTFSGIRPADAPRFILAEVAGALVALAAVTWLLRPVRRPRSAGPPS